MFPSSYFQKKYFIGYYFPPIGEIIPPEIFDTFIYKIFMLSISRKFEANLER